MGIHECMMTGASKYAELELFGCMCVSEDPEIFRIVLPVEDEDIPATHRFSVNCYMFKSDEECLLIDPGMIIEEGKSMLLGALDVLGVNPKNISFFLTHLHADHCELVNDPLFINNPVYLRKAGYENIRESFEQQGLEKGVGARLLKEGLPRDEAKLYAHEEWGALIHNPDRLHFVDGGNVIEKCGLRFDVVAVPGHSPGDLALFEPTSRFVFVGDSVLFRISPVLSWEPRNPDILNGYLKSMRHLLSLDAACMCPGHGGPREDWRERVEWLVGHHLERAQRIGEYVAQNPDKLGMEIIANAGWSLPLSRWRKLPYMQRMSVLSSGVVYLDYLVAEGVLHRFDDEMGLSRYRAIQ